MIKNNGMGQTPALAKDAQGGNVKSRPKGRGTNQCILPPFSTVYFNANLGHYVISPENIDTSIHISNRKDI